MNQFTNLKASSVLNHIGMESGSLQQDGSQVVQSFYVDNMNSGRKIYYDLAKAPNQCGSDSTGAPQKVSDLLAHIFDVSNPNLQYRGSEVVPWASEDKTKYHITVMSMGGVDVNTFYFNGSNGFLRYAVNYGGPKTLVYSFESYGPAVLTIKDFLVQQCLQSVNPNSFETPTE